MDLCHNLKKTILFDLVMFVTLHVFSLKAKKANFFRLINRKHTKKVKF